MSLQEGNVKGLAEAGLSKVKGESEFLLLRVF
jgi:hypothetical protein